MLNFEIFKGGPEEEGKVSTKKPKAGYVFSSLNGTSSRYCSINIRRQGYNDDQQCRIPRIPYRSTCVGLQSTLC